MEYVVAVRPQDLVIFFDVSLATHSCAMLCSWRSLVNTHLVMEWLGWEFGRGTGSVHLFPKSPYDFYGRRTSTESRAIGERIVVKNGDSLARPLFDKPPPPRLPSRRSTGPSSVSGVYSFACDLGGEEN
jgi:hypothetical protein